MKLPRFAQLSKLLDGEKGFTSGRAQLVHVLGALDEGLKVSCFFMVEMWMKVMVFWGWSFFSKIYSPRNLTVEPENDGFPSSESPNFQGLLFQVNHVKFQVCNCWFFLGGISFLKGTFPCKWWSSWFDLRKMFNLNKRGWRFNRKHTISKGN